ncbi:MAG: ComF family protein [Sphingobacteriales bacterium]|jgi:ComF family protein|nr:MAG: ComF family protein [Sphingobacteriales bacterium]
MGLLLYLNDFLSIIFPKLCCGCGRGLTKTENSICLHCLNDLPYTNYHQQADNQVMKLFWGRINILAAAAFVYFKKSSKVQKIMHQLKYHNQAQLGIQLGNMYGKQLAKVDIYNTVDLIVPVPLHKSRLRKRGYNQSEQFALGLSESMKTTVDTSVLTRVLASESQVNKSRYNRYKNMEDIFIAHYNPTYKSIMLVDDTITTGATIEACALALQKVGYKHIIIVGIAFTVY